MIAFTVANPIRIKPEDLPENRPHIGLVMFGDGRTHRIGFNPTARQLEGTLEVAWFSSTGGYVGGVKRPDPPDDGVQRIFHLGSRQWLPVGEDPESAPRSVTQLCRLANGSPEFQFL